MRGLDDHGGADGSKAERRDSEAAGGSAQLPLGAAQRSAGVRPVHRLRERRVTVAAGNRTRRSGKQRGNRGLSAGPKRTSGFATLKETRSIQLVEASDEAEIAWQ